MSINHSLTPTTMTLSSTEALLIRKFLNSVKLVPTPSTSPSPFIRNIDATINANLIAKTNGPIESLEKLTFELTSS